MTDFEVEHHPGSLHNNADDLSHLPWGEQRMVHPDVESNVAQVQSVNVDPLSNLFEFYNLRFTKPASCGSES